MAAPIAQDEQGAKNQHGIAEPEAAPQGDKPRPASGAPAEKTVMPQFKAGGHRQQQASHQSALRGVQGRLGGERGAPERGVGKEPRRKSQVARQLQPQKQNGEIAGHAPAVKTFFEHKSPFGQHDAFKRRRDASDQNAGESFLREKARRSASRTQASATAMPKSAPARTSLG